MLAGAVRYQIWTAQVSDSVRYGCPIVNEIALKDMDNKECYQGPLLLTWFNFNPSKDK